MLLNICVNDLEVNSESVLRKSVDTTKISKMVISKKDRAAILSNLA